MIVGYWLLIGIVWAVINGIISKVDSDGDYFGAIACILTGPLGPLLFVIGVIQDSKLKNK